jgi:hypothetical protein
MKKIFAIIFVLLTPSVSHAQTILSETIAFENGDKIKYIYKELPSGKSSEISYVFDEVNDAAVMGRFFKEDLVIPIKSPQLGTVGDEVCLGTYEKCSFNPPMKLFDKNIKVGDEWRQTFKVIGDTFSSDTTQEVKVIRQEKVRLQIGDFDSFKVVTKAKFKGTTKKGDKFNGTETLEFWVGVVNKKLVLLKLNFSNSFQDKWAIELIRGPSKETAE